jgi:hypothetical protein
MRLTLERIHLYLLDKGFIEPASLADGDYMATQMQTRNIIFRVTRQAAKSLFVKQLNSFDPNNTYVLQKDATCLWLIKNHPAFERLSGYVPDYFGFDPEKQVLVTEYLPDASNLEDYARLNQGSLPLHIREELATVLASYHFSLEAEVLGSRSVQFFPKQAPWVMNLADTARSAQGLLSHTHTPNPVVSAVLGSPEFRTALTSIKSEWVATSLIHGDLKWMNLLVQRTEDREKVKVIDWEIADIGDPLWDVAGILQGFVTNILFYHPSIASDSFSLVPGVGLSHLQDAWPLMNSFWQLYRAHTAPPETGPAAERAALAKTLRFTATRLIQSAIEHNMMLPTIQPNATKLLQASYAMLTNSPAIFHHFTAASVAEPA